MRLAEHVAHTTDVDGMLDSMTPQQFDEWCAKDRIEPIGDEATRFILAMIGTSVLGASGCKDPDVNWFMPWLEKKSEEVTTWAKIAKQKREPDGDNR